MIIYVIEMTARMGARLLGIGANIQLLLVMVARFPEFLENDVLMVLLIMDIIATICIHHTDLLLLVIVDQPVLSALWHVIELTNDETLRTLFIIGCIVHIAIINNNILINMI